jgi:hypothetical protein
MPTKQTDASEVTVLTHRRLLIDLFAHLVTLAALVTFRTPCPTTLIRNGVVMPPPQVGEVQFPDDSIRAEADAAYTAEIGDPLGRDDVQEPRGFKFGEMSEEQAKALWGKRILYRLRIVEEITGRDRRTAYRCKGNECADRFIQFGDAKAIAGSLTDGRELMVEATLLMESALKMGDTVGYRAQFLLTEARIVGR